MSVYKQTDQSHSAVCMVTAFGFYTDIQLEQPYTPTLTHACMYTLNQNGRFSMQTRRTSVIAL